MKQTRYTKDENTQPTLYLAFELSNQDWKLGFTVGLGQSPRQRKITAGDTTALKQEIALAKQRFGLPTDAPVLSCYEAGRDGFWLHRFLEHEHVTNRSAELTTKPGRGLGQHRGQPPRQARQDRPPGRRKAAVHAAALPWRRYAGLERRPSAQPCRRSAAPTPPPTAGSERRAHPLRQPHQSAAGRPGHSPRGGGRLPDAPAGTASLGRCIFAGRLGRPPAPRVRVLAVRAASNPGIGNRAPHRHPRLPGTGHGPGAPTAEMPSLRRDGISATARSLSLWRSRKRFSSVSALKSPPS